MNAKAFVELSVSSGSRASGALSSMRQSNPKTEKRIMSHHITTVADAVPAIRIADQNPDHHLWNNNGTWWIHYTLHLPDYTKQRVRRSLGTRRGSVARRRRDEIFAELLSQPASGLN
jgi:hypothetical protein